jgi:hypothetical protein
MFLFNPLPIAPPFRMLDVNYKKPILLLLNNQQPLPISNKKSNDKNQALHITNMQCLVYQNRI